MKISELRGKTPDQLKGMIGDLRKELFNLRFQQVNGTVEKTSRFRDVRKTIARVNTLIKEAELGLTREVKKESGKTKAGTTKKKKTRKAA